MNDAVQSFLLVYAGLFPIVNPVGSAPIFLVMTRRSSDAERHALAARVAFNSLYLLLGSLLVGSHVLEFFGITLPAVRIGGGLVVTAFAWKLLHGPDQSADAAPAAASAQVGPPPDAFYPLTMPLTVGPGSISVAITLGSQRPKVPEGLTHLAFIGGGALLGVLAVAATVYLCYRFAERIVRALGPAGTNVLIRLSAFILVCIGIQIIWSGYSAFVAGP
jgi:multiple antibiotic resistance protein